MFLSVIKDFSVKKILNNSLTVVKDYSIANTVKTVGLLVDQSYFLETQKVINALIANGILKDNIDVLVFDQKKKKTQNSIDNKDLKWNSKLSGTIATAFVNKKFDLLISYYEIERAILLATTYHSKAHFKVGFGTIDKRFNDLIINSKTENHTIFIQELFKYLKILNKI